MIRTLQWTLCALLLSTSSAFCQPSFCERALIVDDSRIEGISIGPPPAMPDAEPFVYSWAEDDQVLLKAVLGMPLNVFRLLASGVNDRRVILETPGSIWPEDYCEPVSLDDWRATARSGGRLGLYRALALPAPLLGGPLRDDIQRAAQQQGEWDVVRDGYMFEGDPEQESVEFVSEYESVMAVRLEGGYLMREALQVRFSALVRTAVLSRGVHIPRQQIAYEAQLSMLEAGPFLLAATYGLWRLDGWSLGWNSDGGWVLLLYGMFPDKLSQDVVAVAKEYGWFASTESGRRIVLGEGIDRVPETAHWKEDIDVLVRTDAARLTLEYVSAGVRVSDPGALEKILEAMELPDVSIVAGIVSVEDLAMWLAEQNV